MTKDEALKIALQALKTIDEAMPFPVAKLAQSAIKEALAQPEQEPVAWMCKRDDGHFDVLTDQTCKKCFPVYTTPPQRTWVGLTDEEIAEIYNQKDWDIHTNLDYERAIEAKLKEKNT